MKMKKTIKQWSFVVIDWEDAMTFSDGWSNEDDWTFKKGTGFHRTVGMLLKETDSSYAIVQSVGLAGLKRIDHGIEIPKCCVTSIKLL